MIKIYRKKAAILIFLFSLILISYTPLSAQTLWQKIKDKVKQKTDSTVNSTIGSVFNKKDKTGNSSNKKEDGKPKGSELKESDFNQNKGIPSLQSGNSRLKLAGNLFIDVNGIYPEGYKPKWRFITYSSNVDMTIEDWVAPSSGAKHQSTYIAIGDIDGKAKFAFGAFINGSCYADIIIDSIAVITDKPQTFKITKFQKVLNDKQTGEPCIGMSTYTQGGYEGRITLSSNGNGDIKMDLMIENYVPARNTSYAGNLPAAVSYRYIANGITIANEMSPEKANGIITAEREAKQRQKDYIARTTKQADSLEKIIAKKYPQANCITCFYSSSGGYISTSTVDQYYVNTGDYAGSRTDWDLNIKTEIKNKCSYDLKFIGIQQLYDEARGYYLKEVTKVMPAKYSYTDDQEAFASVFISILGGGSEFNIKVQDKYDPGAAAVGYTQWIKVIKK